MTYFRIWDFHGKIEIIPLFGINTLKFCDSEIEASKSILL